MFNLTANASIMAATSFAISITLPNLLLMGLGAFMQYRGQTSKDFIHHASFLVFNYCLPCLLFFSVLNSQVNIRQQLTLITAGIITTVILFLLAELFAMKFVEDVQDKGVFVQGVFRSNMAIIALATVHNAYGEQGLQVGAVYMGVVTILFNVLAVITLSRSQAQNKHASNTLSQLSKVRLVAKKLLTNPLIIALVSAFVYKLLPIAHPHAIIQKVGGLLADVSLPLALICAGASINLQAMLHPSGHSMRASIGRIVVAPIMAVLVGYWLGLTDGQHPLQMGVLFLMVSAPTAAASFVMAKAMGGNEQLAANILAFTTVFSMLGMGIGAGILRAIGWM